MVSSAKKTLTVRITFTYTQPSCWGKMFNRNKEGDNGKETKESRDEKESHEAEESSKESHEEARKAQIASFLKFGSEAPMETSGPLFFVDRRSAIAPKRTEDARRRINLLVEHE